MLEIKPRSNFLPIKEKKIALKIIKAGLDAGLPKSQMEKYLGKNKIRINKKTYDLKKFENVYVVAFGKSADLMVNSICSKIRIKEGIVVIPKKYTSLVNNKKIHVIKSGHPLPDRNSVIASKRILGLFKKLKERDFVIFCVSGGGSALLSYPFGVSLSEKKILTTKLLRSGARIQEINSVRKHLSKVKGGRLVEGLKCSGVSFVISDVEKDDLSAISSGCTYYDKSRFSDAIKVIRKYGLENKIPNSVMIHLKKGSQGLIKETPKKLVIENIVIGNNQDSLKNMVKSASKLGFSTRKTVIYGDIGKCVSKLSKMIPNTPNTCLVFGGEPTIQVVGNGKGGRNQELVLRLLTKIKEKNVLVCSVGSDGIDGNTNYAGAIFETGKMKKMMFQKFLKNNDSNSFFKKYGGLVKTGPTHINVQDFGFIFHY